MKKKYFTDSRNMIEPKLSMNNQIDEHVQVSLYWNRKAVAFTGIERLFDVFFSFIS